MNELQRVAALFRSHPDYAAPEIFVASIKRLVESGRLEILNHRSISKKGALPVARKVILRTIPQRRELGTEKWVESEEKRYQCPGCGFQLTRGTTRCRQCGEMVDLD
jgi:hypothetical protein